MTRYTLIVLVTVSTNYRLTMIEDTQSSTSTTPVTRGSGVEHSQLRHQASGLTSILHHNVSDTVTCWASREPADVWAAVPLVRTAMFYWYQESLTRYQI